MKPFILVVAQDTTHAENLMAMIKSDAFFEGRYRDRVITVHSAQRGEEKDETVQRLLAVEDPNEPTEIVIHVNMLKEGWDVTNLYTIVPLRAANSRTLVEQSIGRGLRLPYGRRTGVAAVDRLTIVAHDRFEEIIREANDQHSIIRAGVVIGKDIAIKPKQAVEIKSHVELMVSKEAVALPEQKSLFTEEERPIAKASFDAIRDFERLPSSRELLKPETQRKIVDRVMGKLALAQGTLDVIIDKPNVESIVRRQIEAYVQNTIDIPRVTVTPVGADSYEFTDFDLDTKDLPRLLPVEDKILIQHLRTSEREQMAKGETFDQEERLEDYIVTVLIDKNDISYDDHADLLYKLSGQMVAYVASYLGGDAEKAKNVVQFYRTKLADLIHAQMEGHVKLGYTDFQASVTRGFEQPKMGAVTIDAGEMVRNFRQTLANVSDIRGMVFDGFSKCLYPQQKFDSDTERQMAILLEDEKDVLRWFKPLRNDVKIITDDNNGYEPDFVVETGAEKLLVETKRADEILSDAVQRKTRAAIKWCDAATKHELDNGGKPWRYLIVPDDAVKPNATLLGLLAQYRQ